MTFGLKVNKVVINSQDFDDEILALTPHRPPMLLINQLIAVSAKQSSAIVVIDNETLFFQNDLGVPSWIGLEYMGQTAALMAGYQENTGLIKPHLGFLISCRNYHIQQEYFLPASKLLVDAVQKTIVGESLLNFDCTIRDHTTKQLLADASLTVFRKAIRQSTDHQNV